VSIVNLQQNAVSQLAAEAEAIGRLAQDEGAFAAAIAAFEANDPDALTWVLQRLEPAPDCRLICEWIRVKWCVLRCFEVCGPLDPKAAVPPLPEFARAIIQLASNQALLRRVVDAVSCGDADAYQAAIAEAKLQNFCHLLCRYVCSTIYRRICEVVCTVGLAPARAADAAVDIQADAEVLAKVVASENLMGVIVKSAATLDCDPLLGAIGQAGFGGDCEIICRWICVWRCVWVCRLLCVDPPPILAGTAAVAEAREFALAARALAGQPRALADLAAAVINPNADAFSAIVNRFGLGPYCWQVCSWVCGEVCYEFCICVCPPPQTQPLFTYIGHFDIFTDIDPASGKTNKGLVFPGLYYNGGPNFAFTGQLQLAGYCPIYSPTFPGVQMKYRFLYSVGGGPQAPITGNLVSSVQAGTQAISWPTSSGGATPIAILPMKTLHLPVIVWGPTPAQPTLPPNPVAPALGAPYVDPTPFYIQPDVNGWVPVDPNVDGTGFDTLMGFDTTQVTPGGLPNPGVPAGTAVPPANQRMGSSVSLTFEATRVTTFPPGSTADYNQAPVNILVNNYTEVNELNLVEFGGSLSCCTPINATASVQYTVDHADMDGGAWSLAITSCSKSAPGDITPSSPHTTLAAGIGSGTSPITVSSSAGFPAPPFTVWLASTGEVMQVTAVAATSWTVTRGFGGTPAESAANGAAIAAIQAPGVTNRGGAGTIVENTSTWSPCSYVVTLTTRPALTNGLIDRLPWPNSLTFCICGH
jgi:hypothetical protein